MNNPSIFAYKDFRLYLQDWWAFRHAAEPGFSKSEASRRLGLPNTRSYFTDVLAGKKVTDLFVDRFCQMLELPTEEAKFFRSLVQFNQAETPEDREIAFDRLVALNRTRYRMVDPKSYQYYRHWWHGAVRAVLAIEDHEDDWATLASRVSPAITARQAKEAVALMEELGFVERDERGCWKPTETSISAGDNNRDELVLQMQMQQFDLARRAIMTTFSTPKDIATSTLSVSASAVETIRDRVHRFRSEVRAIANKDPDPADRVYSLCLAFFPLSNAE